ncbi:MAG: HD domain-containing protein [Deltaproteobacteria bacterium]|nr:MAG: HD domain-containing protein [Deltaproteobacteria bacterium]
MNEEKMTPKKNQESASWEESLFLALYRTVQTLRIHQDNNQLVRICLTRFKQIVSKMDMEDDLTLLIYEGRFYVQGEKVQYHKQLVSLIQALMDFFEKRGLRGLRFFPEVKEVPLGKILAFFRLFIQSIEHTSPDLWLSEQVGGIRFPWVSIIQEKGLRRRQSDPGLQKRARTAYYSSLASVKQVSQKMSVQGYAGVRKAKRMVQNMVDVALEDEGILLGLGTIKDYDDYTYTHSVNVAVLSLCLGHRIGLSRISLERLGICGLFHDLGKVEIPREIVTKPEELNTGEWKVIRSHPLASVRQILKLTASHGLKSEILLAPFEHHMKLDLTGYPQVHFKKEISLFGRILHIADVYDAITSPRVYRRSALSPDQALIYMLKRAGTDFDPILLKVFGTMMGTYPMGTLLELDTGERGLVLDYPLDSGGTLPRIVLLEEDGNGDFRRGEVVDLAVKDPKTGAQLRKVVKSLNAASCGIQPASFIF